MVGLPLASTVGVSVGYVEGYVDTVGSSVERICDGAGDAHAGLQIRGQCSKYAGLRCEHLELCWLASKLAKSSHVVKKPLNLNSNVSFWQSTVGLTDGRNSLVGENDGICDGTGDAHTGLQINGQFTKYAVFSTDEHLEACLSESNCASSTQDVSSPLKPNVESSFTQIPTMSTISPPEITVEDDDGLTVGFSDGLPVPISKIALVGLTLRELDGFSDGLPLPISTIALVGLTLRELDGFSDGTPVSFSPIVFVGLIEGKSDGCSDGCLLVDVTSVGGELGRSDGFVRTLGASVMGTPVGLSEALVVGGDDGEIEGGVWLPSSTVTVLGSMVAPN